MRFAIAVHGTRGDIEPCVAVGLELQRRGHEVRLAVPPNLMGFVESAGLPTPIPYGPDSGEQVKSAVFAQWYSQRNPVRALREAREYATEGWAQMGLVLLGLADGADLILTGTTYQEVAANVAEASRTPLAALHYFPMRANTRALGTNVPLAAVRPGFTAAEWALWRVLKPTEDEQRLALRLPPATVRGAERIVRAGTLEIQAYDEVFFPGIAAEWGGARPVVGSLRLDDRTTADERVAAWIEEADPPVFVGFGSMSLPNPVRSINAIIEACVRLGQRVLVCSDAWEPGSDTGRPGTALVVPAVGPASVFPRCRAVVHHGGAGTTAAGVLAGVPTLVLWVGADQPLWGRAVSRQGLGRSHRLSSVTPERLDLLLADVLDPRRAKQIRAAADRMVPPATAVSTTVDLVEAAARRGA